MTTPQKEGILLVNKPKGKTSFYLVKLLRAITKIKKIGHAGTLDPFATGVMVMLIGREYTKLSQEFLTKDKEYLATINLGYVSDTFDCDGNLSFVNDLVPSLEDVQKALSHFSGEIQQTPPMFSAKKVGGKKLYELARKGIEIERKAETVRVSCTLVEYHYPYLTFQCLCSKGTYVRSLADDIGKMLGCGGYLTELTRLKSGDFYLEDCIDYNTLCLTNFNYEQHLIGNPWKLSQDLKILNPVDARLV